MGLLGFGLSMLSVVINIFVLSGINNRIKTTDGELSKLTTSLSMQAPELNRAEIKNDLFTVLNHVSKLATGDQKIAASVDSIYLLHGYLKRNYGAVNDIPTSEMLKADNEEWSASLAYHAKIQEAKKEKEAGNAAVAEKLEQEAEVIAANAAQPISELGKKLWELESYADPEKLADKSTADVWNAIIPYIKTSNEQFIATYQKKEARIKELQDKKANLSWWANLVTYAAVSLQLFGLMFVLTKDLTKDVKERREKAEKQANKAEEAKLA